MNLPEALFATEHFEATRRASRHLPQLLASYRCEAMRLARRVEYDVACNWKFYVKNLKDAQHVTTVHARSVNPMRRPRNTCASGRRRRAISPAPQSGTRRAALLAGDSEFPPIHGTTGTTVPLIFPNLYIAGTVDCAWYFVVHPVATDRVEQGALFPQSVFDRPVSIGAQSSTPKHSHESDGAQRGRFLFAHRGKPQGWGPAHGLYRSCPAEWCRSGHPEQRWLLGQAAAVGRLTKGSSLRGAMVSRLM
jgi:hypothetical protein